MPPKSSNFSNSLSSTNRVDYSKAHFVEQQAQISPPPLPDIPPPQLLNQQFITENDDILSILFDRISNREMRM